MARRAVASQLCGAFAGDPAIAAAVILILVASGAILAISGGFLSTLNGA